MTDRVEREIEEILAKLDDLPEGQERKPISILAQREKRKTVKAPRRAKGAGQPLLQRVSPTTLLLSGAGTVIGGLILSTFWAPLIWAAFGGVVVFLGGFVSAFVRGNRPAPAANGEEAKGYYWRDRYIEYEPTSPGAWGRFKRRFRR